MEKPRLFVTARCGNPHSVSCLETALVRAQILESDTLFIRPDALEIDGMPAEVTVLYDNEYCHLFKEVDREGKTVPTWARALKPARCFKIGPTCDSRARAVVCVREILNTRPKAKKTAPRLKVYNLDEMRPYARALLDRETGVLRLRA